MVAIPLRGNLDLNPELRPDIFGMVDPIVYFPADLDLDEVLKSPEETDLLDKPMTTTPEATKLDLNGSFVIDLVTSERAFLELETLEDFSPFFWRATLTTKDFSLGVFECVVEVSNSRILKSNSKGFTIRYRFVHFPTEKGVLAPVPDLVLVIPPEAHYLKFDLTGQAPYGTTFAGALPYLPWEDFHTSWKGHSFGPGGVILDRPNLPVYEDVEWLLASKPYITGDQLDFRISGFHAYFGTKIPSGILEASYRESLRPSKYVSNSNSGRYIVDLMPDYTMKDGRYLPPAFPRELWRVESPIWPRDEEHWSCTLLTHLTMITGDPHLRWECRHLTNLLYEEFGRKNSRLPHISRAQGRILQSATNLYWVIDREDSSAHLQALAARFLSGMLSGIHIYKDKTVFNTGGDAHKRAFGYTPFMPWEEGLAVLGAVMAVHTFPNVSFMKNDIIHACVKVCETILKYGINPQSGRAYYMAEFESDKPRVRQGGKGLTIWSLWGPLALGSIEASVTDPDLKNSIARILSQATKIRNNLFPDPTPDEREKLLLPPYVT